MHEAGIAAGVIEIAGRAAAGQGAAAWVRTVKVRIGALTGVAVEALDFAFESLRQGTRCAAATLDVERIPLRGLCPDCGWEGEPEEDFCLLCAQCRAPVTVLSGRELDVEYVDIEDGDGTGNGRNQDSEEER